MTNDELDERLKLRLDYVWQNPGPYAGPAGDLGLEVGDIVFQHGSEPGWTEREFMRTPHQHVTYTETSAETANYRRNYWRDAWSDGTNRTLEKRLKQIKQQEAVEAKYFHQYAERWGPPLSYRTKTFANFKAETSMQEAALTAATCFPYFGDEDDESRHSNIVLTGPAGVGKTHLAAAKFTQQYENINGAEFITATALLRKFREKEAKESVLMARYGDGEGDENDDALDLGCIALIVDDFGVDGDHYAAEIFCEILDRRMGADLRSIFTTNCTRTELRAWLGDRGYSRLLNRCKWIAIDGDDHRLRDSSQQENLEDSR